MCARPLPWTASQSVWSIVSADGIICICINMVHISPSEATLGDQRGRRNPTSDIAALSLWPLQTERVRNGLEQPSIRPQPSRSQPELESSRPPGGCRNGAIRWILGSGYHRNAGCSAECDRVVARRPASERPLLGISLKPTRLLAPITILNGVRKQTPRARQRGWLFRWAVVFATVVQWLLRRSGVCDCPQLRLRRATQPRPENRSTAVAGRGGNCDSRRARPRHGEPKAIRRLRPSP